LPGRTQRRIGNRIKHATTTSEQIRCVQEVLELEWQLQLDPSLYNSGAPAYG
jgi:hypothetical protein